MKKEVLLSLLMTTPVAFPALANVDLTHLAKQPTDATDLDRWIGANNDADGTKVEFKDNAGVTCLPGITKLSRTYSNLPKGNYILEIKELTKGSNLTIQVGDGEPVSGSQIRVEDKMRDGFRVETDKADVTIVITPDANGLKNGFSFTSMNFELVYDFSDNTLGALAALNTLISGDNFIHSLTSGITGQDDLEKQGVELRKRVDALSEKLAALATAEKEEDAEVLFDAYDKGEFFKSPNKYAADGETLKADVAAHNAKVDAANKAHQAVLDNLANYQELSAKQSTLATKLTKGDADKFGSEKVTVSAELERLIKEESAKPANQQNATKLALLKSALEDVKKLIENVNAIKTALDADYEAGKLADKKGSAYKNHSKNLNAYETTYERACAAAGVENDDLNAYDGFTAGVETVMVDGKPVEVKNYNYNNYIKAKALYDKLQREFNGYEPEFASVVTNEYAKQLTDKWNEINANFDVDTEAEKITLKSVIGAFGEVEKDDKDVVVRGFAKYVKGLLEDAANEDEEDGSLAKIKATADDWRLKQLNNKKVADAIVKELTDKFNTVAGKTVPDGFVNSIKTYKDKAQAKLNQVKAAVAAAYGITGDKRLTDDTWMAYMKDETLVRGDFYTTTMNDAGLVTKVTLTKNNVITKEQADYANQVDALNGDGGPVTLATSVKGMQKAVADVNNETLTRLTQKILADDLANINKLTADDVDGKTDAYKAVVTSVKTHEDLLNGTSEKKGLIAAFQSAYCGNLVDALAKYIGTDAKIIAGADYYMGEKDGKPVVVNFSRQMYLDKMVIKVGNQNVTLAKRAADLALEADKFCDKFEEDLRALAEALITFGANDDVTELNKAIKDQRVDFNKAASKANFQAAKDAIAEIDAAIESVDNILNDVPVYGENVNLDTYTDNANSKLVDGGEVYKAYTAAIDKGADDKATALYNKVNDFITKDVKKLKDGAAKTLANVNAYSELDGSLTGANGAIKNLEDENSRLNPLTGDGTANATYKKLVDEYKKTAEDYGKKILEAVKSKDQSKNAAAIKAEYLPKIEALKTAAAKTQQDLVANHTKYQEIGQKADALRQQITSLVKTINDKNPGFNPWKTDTDALESGIVKYLDDIAASYNAGKSVADEVTNLAKLAELQAIADKVQSNLDDNYATEVRNANTNFMLENWNGTGANAKYTKLFNTYSETLSMNSAYRQVTNLGYSKFLNPDDPTKVPSYDVNNDGKFVSGLIDAELLTGAEKGEIHKIETANTLANKAFNEKTNANTVLTKANFATKDASNVEKKPLDLADESQSTLDGYKSQMTKYMNMAAMEYYAGSATATPTVVKDKDGNPIKVTTSDVEGLNTKANENYTTNSDAFDNLGINDIKNTDKYDAKEIKNNFKSDIFAAANTAIVEAAKLYANNYNTDMTKNKLALVMSNIADQLDKVKAYSEEQLEGYAAQYWAARVAVVDQRISEWTAPYGNKVPDDLKTAINKVTEFKAKVAKETNAKKFTAIDATENKANLNIWISDLVSKYNSVVSEYDKLYNDKVTDAKYDANMKAYTDGVEASYNELKGFANSLAAANNSYNQATTRLANVKDAIDAAKSGWTQDKQDNIDSKTKAFNDDLHLDYQRVGNAELLALQTEWGAVNAALTALINAKVEVSDETKARVTALQKELWGLSEGVFTDFEAAKKLDGDPAKIAAIKALQADFLALEGELTTLENEFKNALPGADKDSAKLTAKAVVSKRYTEVIAKVNEAAEFYKNADPEAVQPKYADFNNADYPAQMAALDQKISAETAIIILQKDNYLLTLDEIEAAVDKYLNGDGKDITGMKKDQAYVDESNKVAEGLLKDHKSYADRLAKLGEFLKNDYIAKAKIKADAEADEVADQKKDQEVLIKHFNDKITAIQSVLTDAAAKINEKNKAKNLAERWKFNADGSLPSVEVEDYKDGKIAEKLTKLETHLYQESIKGTENVWDEEVIRITAAMNSPFLLTADKDALIADARVVGAEREKIQTTQSELKKMKEVYEAMVQVIANIRKVTADVADHTYTPGDLNGDKQTNVLDVIEIANLILEEVAYEDLDELKARAADLDFNKKIGIGDLTRLANLAQNKNYDDFHPRSAAPSRGGVDMVSVAFSGVEGGVSRYAVNIQNASQFVAGQIDLVLPAGMTVVGVEGAARVASHDVLTSSSSKRIVIMNMDNAAIEGSEGAVVYVDVIGEGKFDVDNVIFATRTGAEVLLAKPEGTSGIEDTVIDNNGGLKQRIYNAAGQMLRGLQRGVNIIRNADGSVSKEYHK